MSRISRWILLIIFLAAPFRVLAQADVPSKTQILPLINFGHESAPLYEASDISATSVGKYDLNKDGVPEVVVVPDTACGSTRNCSFFILKSDPTYGWRAILTAQGKVTSMSHWGFIPAPRKTLGFEDIVLVEDHGPEPDGSRALRRYVYVWDGNKYVRFSGAYPPADASSELKAFHEKVQNLKREKFQRVPGRKFN